MIPEPVVGPPDNEIWYTSSDGNVIGSAGNFGANIINDEYNDGHGVITFDGPVTSIGNGAFDGCYSLTSITIPNSVTEIEDRVFLGCSALTSITFEGTIAQWNSITKGENWNNNVPATYVQCTDGQVTL